MRAIALALALCAMLIMGASAPAHAKTDAEGYLVLHVDPVWPGGMPANVWQAKGLEMIPAPTDLDIETQGRANQKNGTWVSGKLRKGEPILVRRIAATETEIVYRLEYLLRCGNNTKPKEIRIPKPAKPAPAAPTSTATTTTTTTTVNHIYMPAQGNGHVASQVATTGETAYRDNELGSLGFGAVQDVNVEANPALLATGPSIGIGGDTITNTLFQTQDQIAQGQSVLNNTNAINTGPNGVVTAAGSAVGDETATIKNAKKK